MKLFFRTSLVFTLLLVCHSAARACTCANPSLKERFRKSEAVFIGKVPDREPLDESIIQRHKKGLLVLEVVKAWKGVRKGYVAVDFFEFPKSRGSCPVLYGFEKDTKYLVFAYGRDLKIEVQCSDTRPVTEDSDSTTQSEIRRLDSFWFRFWARVNPF